MELQTGREKINSQVLLELPLQEHDKFDQFWKQEDRHRYSFHNRPHIEGVENAFFTYLNNSSEDNDPLGIRRDLERWNNSQQELGPISFDEFKEILKWAIRYHDTGNIAETIEIVNGILTFKYLTDGNGKAKYTAADAEERSKKIIETAIRLSDIPEEKKEIYIKLAKHLIEQTKFDPENQDDPFAISMRFFDQIGNGLFNENPEMVLGLLEEMVNENPQAKINPYHFFNFTRLRLKELGISEETINKILQILGKKLPDENPDYLNVEMKASDFLNRLKEQSLSKDDQNS